MSTANLVPETWTLTGDDARQTLERTGRMRLLKDGFVRLRAADGFSHARSMAFLVTLVFVQAVIAAVGLASVVGSGGLSSFIVKVLHSVVPGPAGVVLTEAVHQAHQAGSGQSIALILGTIAAVVTGTTLLGQIERALNRIYGVERDRPTPQKYGRAFVLTITAGTLSTLAFAGLGLGHGVTSSLGSGTASTVWNVVRWPLGIAFLVASTAVIFRWAPRRRQPSWSWLAYGAIVAVVLLAIVTVGLDVFFRTSSTFGKTYGPLAGLIALSLWALFASLSVLFGAAIAAQLEAVRAGVPATRSSQKIVDSDPRPATEREPVASR